MGAVEQRIAALRAKLQINTAQEPQWNQVAQVMRDNAQRMDNAFQRRVQMIGTQNAEENMASYAQVAAAHAQGMQNLVPAFHAVYITMTDLQKKAADQVFRDDAHRGSTPRSRQGARR
ncbi:MAG: Spy/CpxP family protein refolding chaperone [Variovorax sp.]